MRVCLFICMSACHSPEPSHPKARSNKSIQRNTTTPDRLFFTVVAHTQEQLSLPIVILLTHRLLCVCVCMCMRVSMRVRITQQGNIRSTKLPIPPCAPTRHSLVRIYKVAPPPPHPHTHTHTHTETSSKHLQLYKTYNLMPNHLLVACYCTPGRIYSRAAYTQGGFHCHTSNERGSHPHRDLPLRQPPAR